MSLRLPTLLLSLAIVLLLLVPASQALPSSPEALEATVGRDYIDLCWQPVAGADSYNLYRGDMNEMVLLANISAPFTAYHDGDLEDGSTFMYYVTTMEGENESVPGNSVSVTVPAKQSADILVPVLAIVLSVIAIQICVVLLMVNFKSKFQLK